LIQHVARPVTHADLDACAAFYELLGFALVAVPPGIAGRALWLERGATQIHLMLDDDARPQAGHVGVIVDEYDRTLAALRKAGYEVDPRREHWGSPRAYVRDPAGHLVEIMAFGPQE
jgi:catechol 2,3-dioxygenase-like lactoylglutathione lyase family enzyme